MGKYNAAVVSIKGKIRDKNEDNYYLDCEYRNKDTIQDCEFSRKLSDDRHHIIAVFDGMGGEKDGEVASFLSALTLNNYEAEIYESGNKQIDFIEVINRLNNAVCKVNRDNKSVMGSTAVIMWINDYKVKVCNIGDSRAYLYRSSNLIQLTEDHTAAANRVRMSKALGIDLGEISPRAANELTQHLGIDADEFLLEPAISEDINIYNNDIYMLCSDGLTHVLSEQDISDVLEQKTDISDKAENLKELALSAGGSDNITIILLQAIL